MAPHFRQGWTFTGQVGGLVAGVLLVAGLINWAAAGRAMSDFARAEVARSTHGLARGAADRVAQIVRMGEIELVTHVATHLGLSGADPARAQATGAAMRRELAPEFAFDGISFIGSDGRLVALDPPAPGVLGADLSQREYVRRVLATRAPFVSDALSARTGRLIVVIAVPVSAPDGAPAGVLAGSLHLANAGNQLARTLASLEGDRLGRYAVTDRRGVVLYATAGGLEPGAPLPAALAVPAAGAPGDGAASRGEVADPLLLRDPETGEPLLGSWAAVPDTGWSVLALVPARQAFAPILRFHRQTFFVSLLTLALAALVSLALSRRLTRPLEVLVSALRDVSRGRTEVRLPEGSAAEWRDLARAFNRMVTELDEYQRQLSERASRDPLTGVLNRGSLDEELERNLAVARRTGAPLAVLMLDLDDFKAYNDTFGHPAGDEVLRALAEAAAANVREGDRVARYGGEEFTVVLPDSDCAAAAAVAERIRAAMAERAFLRPVTVSIGVACHPDHGETPAALIAQADAALYAAKQAGKNRVAVCGDACRGETFGKCECEGSGRNASPDPHP